MDDATCIPRSRAVGWSFCHPGGSGRRLRTGRADRSEVRVSCSSHSLQRKRPWLADVHFILGHVLINLP